MKTTLMIFCKDNSVIALIISVHTTICHLLRSNVLQTRHALEFWMRNVTIMDLIGSANRGLVPKVNPAFTEKKYPLVSVHTSLFIRVIDNNILTHTSQHGKIHWC